MFLPGLLRSWLWFLVFSELWKEVALSLEGEFHLVGSKCQVSQQPFVRVLVPLSPGKESWGKGCSFSDQEQCALLICVVMSFSGAGAGNELLGARSPGPPRSNSPLSCSTPASGKPDDLTSIPQALFAQLESKGHWLAVDPLPSPHS